MAEPFSLTEGTSIFVRVIAENEIGLSDPSVAGNGAVLTIS